MNKCGYLFKALFLLIFYFDSADAVLASESYFKYCSDVERVVQSIFRAAQHLYNSDSQMYSEHHADYLGDALSGFWIAPFFTAGNGDPPQTTYPALAEIHDTHARFLVVYSARGLDASKPYYRANLAPFATSRLSSGLRELNCAEIAHSPANQQQGPIGQALSFITQLLPGSEGTRGSRNRKTQNSGIWGGSPTVFLVALFAGLLALLYVVDKLENRTARRYDVSFPTQITSLSGDYAGTIVNISNSGAKLVSDREFEVGEQVFIHVNSVSTPARVKWNKKRITGVQFSQAIKNSTVRSIRRASRRGRA